MTDLPESTRRRLAEVFGDVLPTVTRDELDADGFPDPADAGEERLLADRPPHHDRP